MTDASAESRAATTSETTEDETAEHREDLGASPPMTWADSAIVAAMAPAGLIVDDQQKILEFRGKVSPFFGPSAGMASLDLLRMAREELRLALRRAIDEARAAGGPVRREGVIVRSDDPKRAVDLTVIPFFAQPAKARLFAVLFEDSASARREGVDAPKMVPHDAIEAELRRELASTREYLQSVVERLEASNHELRAMSEETLSSNEELRSTNEELQRAKEELQATNEELRLINDEMVGRNATAMRLADDLTNVLESVAIPIVILDRNSRIRRFTPAAAELLNLTGADMGRPMSDIGAKIRAPDLPSMIEEVLLRLTPDERTVRGEDGRWYRLAVRPYLTADRRVDGTVLSVFNVDALKKAELQRILEYQGKLQHMAFEATVAEEQERRRIAVDLHDRIGQALAAARLKMMSVCERTQGEARDAIQQALDLVAQTIADTRTLMFDLSPPVLYDLGFREALSWLAEEVEGRHGVHVEIPEYGTPPQLDETTAAILFRSVKELLMNVVKHSDARHVNVSLRTDADRYEIEVSDSGRGFDLDAVTRSSGSGSGSGFGLFSIREQMSRLQGTLEVASAPTQGTRVTLRVPIATVAPEPLEDDGR
jgi:signal transduction histidine kinase